LREDYEDSRPNRPRNEIPGSLEEIIARAAAALFIGGQRYPQKDKHK
jgi:hypothetical protein